MPSPISGRMEVARTKLAALEKLLEKDILEGVVCSVCGSKDIDKMLYTGKAFICQDCGRHCDGCGEFAMKKDLLTIENYDRRVGSVTKTVYCQKCLVSCNTCNKVFPKNHAHRIHVSWNRGNMVSVCRQCVMKLGNCGCCGGMDYKHKIDMCKRCGSSWCSNKDCQRNRESHRCVPNVDMYLSQYNFKPPTIFLPTYRHDELYLGVELEFVVSRSTHYECCDELTKLAKKLGDFFYLKRDGSLGDWGVELVTQPATLDYHIKTPCWRMILNTILKNGGNVNNNCGLHVHISKNYLSSCRDGQRYWEGGRNSQEGDETFKLNLWKLSFLFNKMWPELMLFSRRTCGKDWIDRYCRKPPVATPDVYYELLSNYHESGKYTAVNIVNNYTVEYRMWAATVKETDMLATIQLCAAMSRYVKENSTMSVMKTKDFGDIMKLAVNKWNMKHLAPYLDSINMKWR